MVSTEEQLLLLDRQAHSSRSVGFRCGHSAHKTSLRLASCRWYVAVPQARAVAMEGAGENTVGRDGGRQGGSVVDWGSRQGASTREPRYSLVHLYNNESTPIPSLRVEVWSSAMQILDQVVCYI
eukprot:36438-Eustigmatos_ZCMA.PRE.1